MKVLLLAIGSHGDVHPFVGIGKRLRERGHVVTVAANEAFSDVVSGAGLKFAQLGTEEEYRRVASDPAMWGRTRSFNVVMEKGVLPGIRPMYELVMDFVQRAGEEKCVVAGSSLAIGMRVAEEKLNKPMALVHLAPAIVRTNFDVPRLPGSPVRAWMPGWMKRMMYWAADTLVIDRVMRGPVNALRREVGLGDVKGHVWDWWNGSHRIIGMWPEWFGPWQEDWPGHLKLAGFALYDEKERRGMGDDVARFLAAGDAPVAFTAGSAMWSGHHFFEESALACERAGCRGLLLTKHREMVPEKLPPGVIHVSYAPFSELFGRCAAVVHHGGIGTTAQALASGAKQIVMPFAHDQLDNANRVVRLGCGRWVEPGNFRAKHVAQVIDQMRADEAMGRVCESVRARFLGDDGIGKACELIEAL